MHEQIHTFLAEVYKNKRARAIWISFIAFSLAPLFGAVLMLLMKDSGFEGLSGVLKSKAIAMSFQADWPSLLSLLSNAVGVGGVLVFGFAASWLFGREYSDGTAKDLLALPVTRTKILNAKFIYYSLWCLALTFWNLILGILSGFLLELPGWQTAVLTANLRINLLTSLMIILLNTPVAFFALAGRGYLAPLGVVALTLVLAQIVGALGFGTYFPWSVPGIYSGSGGEEMRSLLNTCSFLIVILTGLTGYIATLLWWKYADQKN